MENKSSLDSYLSGYPRGELISIKLLMAMQKELMDKVPHGLPEHIQRQVVAGLGIIEETLEYLNSLGHKPWRPTPLPEEDQLEEITDILFFYLELLVMSGFSWGRIVDQYYKKHAENLNRYKRLAEGDTSWDDRLTKEGL